MKGVPLNEKLYDYIINTFVQEDELLKQIPQDAERKNIPLIQVSPENGKFLFMLIKMIRAKYVLEIGTLTGYSSIWMARALPEDGKLITIEISPEHAAEARKNFSKSGLENKITLMEGRAADIISSLNDRKFDFVFIDADKENTINYYDAVFDMVNIGGIIATDNTLREGKVIEVNPDPGTRAINAYNRKVANDSRVISLLIPISDGLTISLKL
jgi:predicted O-methyltransferase YrrM